ncbi:MAG: ATP-binding protein [Hydrogenovibrio sp.]|nr:ATP-binding protein [Hydrogenovibrio sp.]
MNFDQNRLARQMLDKSLWWCLGLHESEVTIKLSDKLQERLGTSVETCDEFLSYMVPESAHHFMSKTQSLIEAGEDGERFLTCLEIDSEMIWLINELHYSKQDNAEFICATCIDVTEMHELEEKLIATNSELIIEKLQAKEIQSQKEKDLLREQYKSQTKFLAMLSHELRTPLMGVNSLIDVIKQNSAQGEDISDPLQVMRLTIDQLNFLINDILTYSQTESEQVQIHPTSFSIEEMAEYVRHLTKAIANDKGVVVSISIKAEHTCFFGDLLRISQILVNLVVNAIKFTQHGGVFVEIEERPEKLRFTITDSGEGISVDQIEDIFKPFKQLKSKGSEQYLGSGLGLPIVKRLVDLLEGSIKVESTKGVGTSFIVDLPVGFQDCPETASTLPEANFEIDEKQKLIDLHEPVKVLIADDSIINRKVLELFLYEINCEVEHAEDGVQAWNKFLEKDYDFVFLDIQMPGMNGVEVCQKIRDLDDGVKPNLKGIYALTAAHTEQEILSMGIEIDKNIFDDWIEKPISQDKVLRALYTELVEREEVAKKPLLSMVPEMLSHLIPQFVESTDQDLKKLNELFREKNEAEFRKLCHSLKGNVMLFELEEMLEVIQLIEQESFAENESTLQALLDRLNQIYLRLY